MLITTMTCDACGGDLTDSGSMPDHYLTLSVSHMHSSSGTRFAVSVRPPIPHNMHFCNLRCLKKQFSIPDEDKSHDG